MNEKEGYVRRLLSGPIRIESWDLAHSRDGGWIDLIGVVFVCGDSPIRRVVMRASIVNVDMVDVNPKDEYLKILEELIRMRKNPEYNDKMESEYCDRLDHWWKYMTNEQLDEVNSIKGEMK